MSSTKPSLILFMEPEMELVVKQALSGNSQFIVSCHTFEDLINSFKQEDVFLFSDKKLNDFIQLKKNDRTPIATKIIFFAFNNNESIQLHTYKEGADAFIVIPEDKQLLTAQINAILKCTGWNASGNTKSSFILDKEKHVVVKNGEEIFIPKKEFKLLTLLMSKPGKIFNREVILYSIWGEVAEIGGRTLDVHIRNLRKRIGVEYITTIKGIGYKINC